MVSRPREAAKAISSTDVEPQSNGNEQRYAPVRQHLDSLDAETVALVESIGEVGHHAGAEVPKPPDEQSGPGDPVGIEVSEDAYRLSVVQGAAEPGHRNVHVREEHGVVPQAPIGRQVRPDLGALSDTPVVQQVRLERRKPQPLGEPGRRGGQLAPSLDGHSRVRAIHAAAGPLGGPAGWPGGAMISPPPGTRGTCCARRSRRSCSWWPARLGGAQRSACSPGRNLGPDTRG